MVALYALKNRQMHRLNIGEESYILMNLRKIREAKSAWITLDQEGAIAKC